MADTLNPLLSVCMVTYNHERFIAKSIESVLNQRTDFPFELCIGEDDSSDSTRALCQEYARNHPNIIRLFERSRSDVVFMEGKATGAYNFIQTLKACQGKYIALLEGDDYWIYPEKLQKQVELLEGHNTISGCFHDCVLVERDEQLDHLQNDQSFDEIETDVVSLSQILKNGSVAPTASMVFRKDALFPLPEWYCNDPSDWKIEIQLAMQGSFRKLNNCYWSFYRQHERGIYNGDSIDRRLAFRLRQAKQLQSLDMLADYKLSLEAYCAHSYHIAADAHEGKNRWKALFYLYLFLKHTELPFGIKLKHFLKKLILTLPLVVVSFRSMA